MPFSVYAAARGLMGDKHFMDEEERKWKQFEQDMRQLAEEQEMKHPDLFILRSIGCFIGGILGPVLLVAFVFLASAIYPENGGSNVMLFLCMLIAIPIGGGLGAFLIPFVVKLINSFINRSSK